MRRKNWYLTIGGALSACMLAFTAVGLVWTPYPPTAMSAAGRNAPPCAAHPFGCDSLGRDVLSRTLEGAGSTLAIALAVLAVGAVCGLAVGALCGWYGGPADALVMRLCDAVAAFPSVLLALVVLALTGPGKYNVIGALGVLFIPSFARLTRGEFLKYRDRDFVKSARLMGVGGLRIVFVHILPNIWPTLLSGLTIGFNNAVLAEASMSYLGIGVSPTEPSLGYMLKDAQGVLFTLPWCTAFPALAVILLILGVGLVGEGIRERMGGTS
ncbi:MAG: ABC transporter permease [Oscillospiraceae bacterium]|nr:ABC transporter permease [Oscillospiraceae bacterium]